MIKEPTLYILMRDDLASLNPGKAIAQGSHATNIFEADMSDYMTNLEVADGPSVLPAYEEWQGDRRFGRCLTVAAKPWEIEQIMGALDDGSNYLGAPVVDPTYPISDGEVTHAIELMTCAYVFAFPSDEFPDQQVARLIKRLSLYK